MWLTVVGMAEIFAHELLHRQHARPGRVAAQLGDAELIGPIEHVGRLAARGSAFRCATAAGTRWPAAIALQVVVRSARPGRAEFVRIGRAVANQTDPADQLDVAERAPRALDIRLQQENRLAVTDAAPPAGLRRCRR